jgi:adenylate cyclase
MTDMTGAAPGPEGGPGERPGESAPGAQAEAELRTFLIADIRGYTTYTEEHGSDAAAALAGRFATVVREVVTAHDGFLLELRGDEALAVFVLARRALRAALDLQTRFAADLPIGAGIGLDAGEAIPVEGGYRGSALNLAARLCSQAGPGETLASEAVIHLAAKVEGIGYADPRTYRLKGIDEPIRAVHVVPAAQGSTKPIRYGGEQRRPTRRLLAAGVVGLAAVAVFIAAILALGSGGFAGRPAATLGGQATAMPATATASASDASYPNAAEKALLADLAAVPDVSPDTCARDPESPFRFVGLMVAGVSCSLDVETGASELVVRRFAPGTVERHGLSTWIKVEVGHQGRDDALPEGDCTNGFPAIGPWSLAGEERGILACGIDEATGDALMAWADDYGGLLMSARNPRGDSKALYRFFEKNARFIAP